jgi:hypothetical protein
MVTCISLELKVQDIIVPILQEQLAKFYPDIK